MSQSGQLGSCPLCLSEIKLDELNSHVNECLNKSQSDIRSCKRKSTFHPVFDGVNKKPKNISQFFTKSNILAKSEKLSSKQKDVKENLQMNDIIIKDDEIKDCDNSDVNLKNRVNQTKKTYVSNNIPLSEAMRPATLIDFIGQEQAVGPDSLLGSLVTKSRAPSLIMWGPPGCGKTTLVRILANLNKQRNNTKFVQLFATSSGVNEMREAVKIARTDRTMFRRETIMFIDEIHRFNKTQQDTLLPHIEDGTIILMGATTENPSFQVTAALLSRCKVVVMEKLTQKNIEEILLRALGKMSALVKYTCQSKAVTMETYTDGSSKNTEESDDILQGTKGGNNDDGASFMIDKSTVCVLAGLCDGDARVALNSLQMAVDAVTSADDSSEPPQVTLAQVKKMLQRSHVLYDKTGDEHYNCISALHKSIRGSDCNGALYWLARMLEGGENPLYVARRLIRIASEDIGLAEPQALQMAVSTHQACHFLGMPECDADFLGACMVGRSNVAEVPCSRIQLNHMAIRPTMLWLNPNQQFVILAQCVVSQCRCLKSVEVYSAYKRAKSHVLHHQGPLPGVPLHLRNAPTRLMKGLGYGAGYKYNPDYNEPIEQSYLPSELMGTDFFTDTSI